MTKGHFGVQVEVDFLGQTITTKRVAPQKQKIKKIHEKVKFPRSKKALQRYNGFLKFYRKYIPRLAERLTPFFQLLKTTDAKAKIPITPDIMKELRGKNEALDRRCQLALRQPLPSKHASFQAAVYAVLQEDDPNQKYTSTRKTYAPIAYGSKTYSPSQNKMSIYAKVFLAICMAFKEIGHNFWGAIKPMIIMTDSKSVTRFFQTKMIPPPFWNACDFVLQFNFTIAQIAGKMNTAADFLSSLEMVNEKIIWRNEKIILKIREDNRTKPIELNIDSTGIAQDEPVFFDTTDQQETTENELWKRKGEVRKAIPSEPPVITVSCFYANDLHKDTTIVNIAQLTKPSRILIEQDSDPTLLNFKREMLGLPFDEQILLNDARYMH